MAIDEIEKASCIKFRPANVEDKDWIDIVDTEEGCFADLGFKGVGTGKHVLNLQRPDCVNKGTAIHELFHNFGMNHEQTRPDRDKYMTINWKNMRV